MEKYTYSEYWDFEAKLVEAVKDSPLATEMVIEQEYGVCILHSWGEAINYYGEKYLAEVLTTSAEKSIISSNSKYYIAYDEYFECTDDLMDIYGDDFSGTIYYMWGNGERALFGDLCDVHFANNWCVYYIDNAPSDAEIKIINTLVANKEHDLLEDLAKDKEWAIYWN